MMQVIKKRHTNTPNCHFLSSSRIVSCNCVLDVFG